MPSACPVSHKHPDWTAAVLCRRWTAAAIHTSASTSSAPTKARTGNTVTLLPPVGAWAAHSPFQQAWAALATIQNTWAAHAMCSRPWAPFNTRQWSWAPKSMLPSPWATHNKLHEHGLSVSAHHQTYTPTHFPALQPALTTPSRTGWPSEWSPIPTKNKRHTACALSCATAAKYSKSTSSTIWTSSHTMWTSSTAVHPGKRDGSP